MNESESGSEGFDIIGDVHGHYEPLVSLLREMGYEDDGGCFAHPTRKAVFVGDLIDRGPRIRDTLELVKAMADRGEALVVLGNHEYNAVCYCASDGAGGWLRPHSEKNRRQFRATADEFADDQDAWRDYLEWFRSLPLSLDMGAFRVVHACWSQRHLELLAGRTLADAHFLAASALPGSPEFHAVETVLKGPELKLPEGVTITDKEGTVRGKTRVKWWIPTDGATLRSISFPEHSALPELDLADDEIAERWDIYEADAPPVFVGHYWLPPSEPKPFQNVVCLDYSVAAGGFMAAYRWTPGGELSRDGFVDAASAAQPCLTVG